MEGSFPPFGFICDAHGEGGYSSVVQRGPVPWKGFDHAVDPNPQDGLGGPPRVRGKAVLGLLLVVAGGLLVLFAPAAPAAEPLAPASLDAPTDERRPSLLFMAAGAFAGLVGLALLAGTMQPRDLE